MHQVWFIKSWFSLDWETAWAESTAKPTLWQRSRVLGWQNLKAKRRIQNGISIATNQWNYQCLKDINSMDQDLSKISKNIFTCWLVRLSLCLLLQNLIQYGWSREKILPGGSMLMAQCLSWIFFLVEMDWLFFTWIENAQISNEKSPEI